MTYLSRLHDDAMLAAMRAAVPPRTPGGPDRIGDAVAPADTALPYAVMYPLGSSTFDGSSAPDDLDSDAWPVTQVTVVGVSREQVQALRDQIRTAVLGAHLVVDGRKVGPIRLHDERPLERDDDVTPPLLYAVDRYRTFSTPS